MSERADMACDESQLEEIIGFIITPGEIADRIAAMNESILGLNTSVQNTPVNAEGFNDAWKAEWDAFVRRWSVERDAYASWDSRLFATRVMPRLDDFQASYNQWARDFQRKTGKAPLVPKMREQSTLIPSYVAPLVVAVLAGLILSYRKK